jgi:SAM-dependent methyltransferase
MIGTQRIFEEMRRAELNDWVGGLDPELIGDACLSVLELYLDINSTSRLLDFGCGIGRVLLSILKHKLEVGRIAGFDILPQVISFCNDHIARAFPQATFELIEGRNAHYDRYIAAAGAIAPKSHALLQREYGSAFTGAYAFSVFTHVEMADFRSLLGLLSGLLQPGGTLFFTAFLLTPLSRQSIQQRTTWFPLAETAAEADGDILIGNVADRLSFIAFDQALVERMVSDAGLEITHVERGFWAGANSTPSMQDVVVCRRPYP